MLYGQTREDYLGKAEQQHKGAVPDGHSRKRQATEPFTKDHTRNETAPQQVSNCRGAVPNEGGWKYTDTLLHGNVRLEIQPK